MSSLTKKGKFLSEAVQRLLGEENSNDTTIIRGMKLVVLGNMVMR